MEDRQGGDGWDWWEEVGLEGNDRGCDWEGLVVLVSVSVHTQLLRDLLADSHWGLLVDFVTNFVGNVLSEREQFLSNNNDNNQTTYLADLVRLLCTFLVRNISASLFGNLDTDLRGDILTDRVGDRPLLGLS